MAPAVAYLQEHLPDEADVEGQLEAYVRSVGGRRVDVVDLNAAARWPRRWLVRRGTAPTWASFEFPAPYFDGRKRPRELFRERLR